MDEDDDDYYLTMRIWMRMMMMIIDYLSFKGLCSIIGIERQNERTNDQINAWLVLELKQEELVEARRCSSSNSNNINNNASQTLKVNNTNSKQKTLTNY